MNSTIYRPTTLWLHEAPTISVDRYIDAHRGEFSTNRMVSRYPYHGPPSALFRRLTRIPAHEAYDRFEAHGMGCWTLKRDGILNDLTADLLAAADFLRGKVQADGSCSGPGGIGLDSSKVWVAFLDGGIGVEVQLYEHQSTNRVSGTQRTTIRGAKAYRALLELLGFDWINRKLEGEVKKPDRAEIAQLVEDAIMLEID
jgi:hypothetical protein